MSRIQPGLSRNSKQQLHQRPHAADTAVGEFAVQEAPRKGIEYTFSRWIGVPRIINADFSAMWIASCLPVTRDELKQYCM